MAVPTEKIALFIDGANLYATAKSLGFDIDYKRLLREFQSRGYLLRAFYYTAVIEDQEYSSIRPLIDWLDYNGYTVVTKATKEFVDQTGRRKVKGNMDIELAVDAMEIAGTIDHMVLFGRIGGVGDSAFLIENAYFLHAGLGRHGFNEVISTLLIVDQHVVRRAVLDDVADAFRAEQSVLLEMLAVEADVEVAQQSEDHYHGAEQEYVELRAESKSQAQPAVASWLSLLHAPSPLRPESPSPAEELAPKPPLPWGRSADISPPIRRARTPRK